jgi:hypothetical protein
MRGDEVLLVTLRNMLGRNFGASPIGPYPDPISYELPPNVTIDQVNAKARQLGLIRDDVCLGEHTNGLHAIHDTNLHTHGLHVRPGPNPDGTQSDNIFMRLISRQDFLAREDQAASPSCQWLRDPEQTGFLTDDETVGFQDFDFHVGDVQASRRARLGLPPSLTHRARSGITRTAMVPRTCRWPAGWRASWSSRATLTRRSIWR